MSKWSEDDIDYLIAYGLDQDKEPVKELAEFLGRSEHAVIMKLSRLRKEYGQVSYNNRPWTDREIKVLENTYIFRSNKQIAESLGRSENAVKIKADRLGISKNAKLVEKDSEIKSLANQGHTRQEIALLLNLPCDSVTKYIWAHSIECRKVSKDVRNKYWRDEENIRRAYTKGKIKE